MFIPPTQMFDNYDIYILVGGDWNMNFIFPNQIGDDDPI